MHLSALYRYPLKSAAAIAVDAAEVTARGLRGDRHWLVIDGDDRFVTGRQCPLLVRVVARDHDDGLRLQAPGHEALDVATPAATAPRRRVTVWRDEVDAADAGDAAADWLSRVLQRPLRLVAMDARSRRAVDPAYGRSGDEVSFADGYPLLVVGHAALAALNARLARPLPMLRFRPNLVVDGGEAHAEDGWRRVRIGTIAFDAVKPCTRCVFTTVDPASGTVDADGEPLRTLKTYRRSAAGITFGMNLIARGGGTLRLGDAVTVLA